jgi:hypothetical protein
MPKYISQSKNQIDEAVFGKKQHISAYGFKNIPANTRFAQYKQAEVPGVGKLNIPEVNRTQLMAALHNCFVDKSALIVWGDTGVSKSAAINAFAKQVHEKHFKNRQMIKVIGLSRPVGARYANGEPLAVTGTVGTAEGESTEENKIILSPEALLYKNPKDYFFIADVRLAYLEELDIGGFPFGDILTGMALKWTPPLVYLSSHPDAAGVVFFDEFNRTDKPTVMSALLSIFDAKDKKMGNHPIAKNVMPVAAGNVGSQFLDVKPPDAALLNRGYSMYLNLTVQEWLQWGRERDSELPAYQDQNIHPLVLAFIESLPAQKLRAGRPEPGEFGTAGAECLLKYPTWRGYELLSSALYRCIHRYQNGELESETKVIDEAIQMADASNGSTFGQEFRLFAQESLSVTSLEDIEKLDFNDASQSNKAATAIEPGLLSLAEQAFVEKDKNAEKMFRAWCMLSFRLEAEKLKAMLVGIKASIDREISNGNKDLEGLAGEITTAMMLELGAAKSKMSKEAYEDRLNVMSSVAGMPVKTI